MGGWRNSIAMIWQDTNNEGALRLMKENEWLNVKLIENMKCLGCLSALIVQNLIYLI